MSDQNAQSPNKAGALGIIVKVLLRLVVLSALLGVGFGAGWFYFANPMSPTQNALSLLAPEQKVADVDSVEDRLGHPQRIPREMPDTALFETFYYQMEEPLTTNLNGSRRYLQIGIGMSTQYGQGVIDNVNAHQVALRSDILGVMGDFTEEQVSDNEGRQSLSDAIKVIANKRLEALEGFGGIEGVFFTSFVLQ